MGWVLSNKTAFQFVGHWNCRWWWPQYAVSKLFCKLRPYEEFSGILVQIAKILVRFFIRFAM